MINLNTDITKLLQLESLNVSVRNNNSETSKITTSKQEKESEEATKVSISEQASSQIDEITSEEDILSLKINKAQTIYDTLTDIRLKLKDLMQLIKDPEMKFDKESLKQIDSMSNSLIENTISVIRKNDDMNIVNPNFLNIYISGLQSIKELSLTDNDFLTKIQSIQDNVKTQQQEYLKASDSLVSNYINLAERYENLVNKKIAVDNKNLDKQIIATAKETVKSTVEKISPDTVLRLIQD